MVKKAKVKEWFVILAPEYFKGVEIGKALASESSMLVGRIITVSAIELTNDINKYYMKLFFKISKIENGKALTEFNGSECLSDYISRMIVRRVRRIDTVQNLTTKEGKQITVKSIAILSRKVKTSVQKIVGKRIKELLKEEVEKLSLEEIVEKILSGEIKNKVLQEARKIYPIRNLEIRKTEVV